MLITVETPTTELAGRRWHPEVPPAGRQRTRRHCGAVILEVTAASLSWQGVEEVLHDVLIETMGPDARYELQTRREPVGGGVRVLTMLVWDVGPLALTVLARRLEIAVETTVAWASVDTGCAAGRDSDPEQLLVRAQRALARRRAERVRRRLGVGALAR
ncbi:MAG TPA: hypothetical protein VF112_04975 [Candidatus Dormibacteraeota bacterium]